MEGINSLPFVSVIMPIKDERKSIEQCISGFLQQSYPRERFEVVVADRSGDGTREILEEYAKRFPGWLRLCDNPTGRTTDGYNVALDNSKGEIVANYIGHAFPHECYIERVVTAITENSIDMIGGKVIPLPSSNTKTAMAIALALQSPFTVGPNAFTRNVKRGVSSTHWMAVRRKLINKVGRFNTTLTRGEDCDWYERMIATGAHAVFDPSIISYYYARSTYRKQSAIQVLNAWYRVRTYFITGRGMRIHHLFPVLGVIAYFALSVLVFRSPSMIFLPILLYGAIALGVSIGVSKPYYQLSFRVWAATILIHAGHSVGMLGGLVVFSLKSLRIVPRPY